MKVLWINLSPFHITSKIEIIILKINEFLKNWKKFNWNSNGKTKWYLLIILKSNEFIQIVWNVERIYLDKVSKLKRVESILLVKEGGWSCNEKWWHWKWGVIMEMTMNLWRRKKKEK